MNVFHSNRPKERLRLFQIEREEEGAGLLLTNDLSLLAKWVVKHYQQWPDIEQDYEQLKSSSWLLTRARSTVTASPLPGCPLLDGRIFSQETGAYFHQRQNA